MKPLLFALLLLGLPLTHSEAKNRIYDPNVKSLTANVNGNWLSPAVMRFNSNDVLYIGFDELSHTYHRYTYQIEHCEADWTTSEDLFESDFLESFNDNPIEDYEKSLNTTVPYTHYNLRIPNEQCRLKMSGNYRLHVIDEENSGEEILMVEFMVSEQTMGLALESSTDTDIDTNARHQQLSIRLDFRHFQVTNPEEQIYTVVMQNNRDDDCRINPEPTFANHSSMTWTHCRDLIFNGDNEYRKFELLDMSHPTMGIEKINWDGHHFQAWPFTAEVRPYYIYDEDANGAFCIRNSDNTEINTTCDYALVNYRLKMPKLEKGTVTIDGWWTVDDTPAAYDMSYNENTHVYETQILQKQGYYSYQFRWKQDNGDILLLPSQGNFHETENSYQVLVYYKGIGERTWRLTAFYTL